MHFGLPEILIVILIVILLFGPGRVEKLFSEMGKGIKSFKDGLQGKKEDQPAEKKGRQARREKVK
jgi:sec-independent protein translocase protein TatA